ncbi:type II toxin-antitoxin system PemK/MazF family toxin [candidate division KSB1 bacterium]|nr:type II toxin-antitoxin system PemK/MazF family toxin [candidate division KSB1 bacterium]
MERGEIRCYTFKSPDNKRPVVILTRSSALNFLGEVTLAPITSTVRDIPMEVILDQKDGMKNISAVNLDHVQTVSKNKVGELILKLSESKIEQIKSALLFASGFDN